MDINGPLKVARVEREDQVHQEFEVRFTSGFKSLTLEQQGAELTRYRDELQGLIHAGDADSLEVRGMMSMLQIVEELLPHVVEGNVALEQPLMIEYRIGDEQHAGDNLIMNLLKQ